MQRQRLYKQRYALHAKWQTRLFIVLEVMLLIALRDCTPFAVVCYVMLWHVNLHMIQMVFLPRYRKKMRTIVRFGIIPAHHRVSALLNFVQDTNLTMMFISPLSILLSWNYVILGYFVANLLYDTCAFRERHVSFMHWFHDQRFAPLLNLQEWFQQHEEYDKSIHSVINPIIRELYTVSTPWPFLFIEKDVLYDILQKTSDWACVEEHKTTQKMLERLISFDLANIVLQFANITLGNNEHRKMDIVHDIDVFVMCLQKCMWTRVLF